MATNKQQPGHVETKPETRRLLTAAEYFLQHRSFSDCSKYAVRALNSDPNHPAPTRIISVASVLSASKISSTQHDYYAVLDLPYFDSDVDRIGSSFKARASILDPKSNSCPHSSEAFELVLKAWSVLSNPVEKAKFDDELRRKLTGCTCGNGGGTFWTMCPYCYHVYEYDNVFEGCCLRCANERCRRVLHAVAIGAPPPPHVVEKGHYWCAASVPIAIGSSKGEKLWNPFAPATDCDGNVASNERGGNADAETVERKGFENHGDGKKMKIEDEAGNSGHTKDANGGRLQCSGGITMKNGVKEVRTKRKKSVL